MVNSGRIKINISLEGLLVVLPCDRGSDKAASNSSQEKSVEQDRE